MAKNSEYLEVMADIEKAKTKALDFIRKNVIEKHNGHHCLDDYETFYESPYEDDDEWKITEINVCDKYGDIYYAHSEPLDEDDWHNIHNLFVEDIIYIMGIYS
jgi:hypothetical protein